MTDLGGNPFTAFEILLVATVRAHAEQSRMNRMPGDSVELTISVPASLADPGVAERARLLLVLDAVRNERMAWRAAAATLNVAPDRFLELARDHSVPVVRYEASDWNDDLSTLAKLDGRRFPGR
jgi:hypothetical protein